MKFTGTDVYLYGSTAPTYGQALVSVDGGTPVLVDYYSASYLHKVKVFEAKRSRAGRAHGQDRAGRHEERSVDGHRHRVWTP